jgi:two-component system, cell cycle sensor histidine kinase and response regulator CckA
MVSLKSRASIINDKRSKEEQHLKDRLLSIRNNFSRYSAMHQINSMLAFHKAELDMQYEALYQSTQELEDGFKYHLDLFCYAPPGYLILRRDGTIVDINFSFSKLLGREASTLKESSLIGCITERDRQDFYAFLENLFTTNKSDFCLVNILNQNNEILVHITGSASDDAEHCSLIVQEITREHTIEQPQEDDNESIYRFIAENTGDVIWLYDFKKDNYLYITPSVFRMRGFTPEEIQQQSLFNAFTPASGTIARNEIARHLKALKNGDESARFALFEFDQLHKDGSVVPTEVMATFIQDEEGNLSGIIGVDRDISWRKRLEREKVQLQHKIVHTRKMESLERIAGGIGHDFNNKLQAILGNTDLLMASGELDPRTRESLLDIRHAVMHCTGLTNQLLSFARKRVIVPQVLNINAELSQTVQSAKYRSGRTITIDFQPESDLWPVKIDPSQLNEIMHHLIKNALEAIEDGGNVTIKTRNVLMKGEKNHLVENEALYDAVLIEIVDTGHGMEREALDHIFEPFFTTKANSSGLGLSTVYGIVEQNNGFISVDSIPGIGSTFRIFLPRYEAIVDAGSMAANVDGCPVGTETILLVDDEESIRTITCKFLESFGYTVLLAENADDALRKSVEYSGKIHLLLTDLIMPGMNGKELSDLMKKQRPEMTTLFMSGYSNNIFEVDSDLPNDLQFLGKPFSRTTLSLKVREVLDAGKGRRKEP